MYCPANGCVDQQEEYRKQERLDERYLTGVLSGTSRRCHGGICWPTSLSVVITLLVEEFVDGRTIIEHLLYPVKRENLFGFVFESWLFQVFRKEGMRKRVSQAIYPLNVIRDWTRH